VVGAAFFAFLELGSSGSSSAGLCLGEIFLLEAVFLEGVCWVGGVCSKLGSAGALPLPLAGDSVGETWGEHYSAGAFLVSGTGELSDEETISSTKGGSCLEEPAGLEGREVL